MKGTIDVQIKHKDGSVETRHENNVVFDIPALVLKKSLEYPEVSRVFQGGVAYYSYAYDPSKTFQYFGLSEDAMDLTAPAFRPIALRCMSGTASKWYNSATTRTVEDKKITVQATWTAQNALTLKSIGFLHSDYPGDSILTFFNNEYYSLYITHVYDGHLYPRKWYSFMSSEYKHTPGASIYDLKLSDFKFTNRSLGGLHNKEDPTKVHVIPYALANPNERAAFTRTTFEKCPYQYPNSVYVSGTGTGYYTRLCIYDKNDVETPLRYFDLSQFEGAITSSSYLSSFFIVNTGTKNYLIQIVTANSTNYRNIWQIPDAAVEESANIPLLSSQSLNDALADVTSSVTGILVAGNYVALLLSSGFRWVQISDDLSVKTYGGYSAEQPRPDTVTTTPEFRYISKNELGVHLASEATSNMYLPGYSFYTNSTAANFSTPIVLAQGDVLTVSYKIEVA